MSKPGDSPDLQSLCEKPDIATTFRGCVKTHVKPTTSVVGSQNQSKFKEREWLQPLTNWFSHSLHPLRGEPCQTHQVTRFDFAQRDCFWFFNSLLERHQDMEESRLK